VWHSGDEGEFMIRIPSHSIEDAPQAARSLLAEMVQFSPTGRLLNLHAQMAHAPAVPEAYVSIRRAAARHGTLEALRAGKELGEEKTDALIGVVREAAANRGHVSDLAWARAAGSGWSDEQLAEAFVYLGLTVFTSYFLNYAETELDVPAGPPGFGPAGAGPPATTSGAGS
jgi:hypothetical protein